MVCPIKMRNDKLNIKQFFIYHFYDFMFFTDLDNTFTRSRALGWSFDPALQLLPELSRRTFIFVMTLIMINREFKS